MKTEVIHARIEPFLKQNAEKIFRKLGMTTTEAISIFLNQVVLNKGLPFSVNIPNAETRKAIKDGLAGKVTRYKSSKEMFDDLAYKAPMKKIVRSGEILPHRGRKRKPGLTP